MEADLPRGGDLFAAGLSHEGARTVRTLVCGARCLRAKTAVAPSQACSELSERLGLSVPAEVLINHPTISRLAEAVLQRGMVSRAAAGFSVASLIKSFMELQVARQVVDPRRSRPPNAARNPGRMVIVLAGPRSGSTLTQLVLNMHSQLYAGQELYLLPFFTMKERAERLGSRELSSWVFEGLRKTVMELRNCTIEEADDLLEQMTDFRTQDVLSILQAWAGDRILVDKTPPYIWSLDTLRRAEQLFEEVQYIHVYRHPYANISSMAAEAINRDFIADAAGAASPAGWEQQVCSTPQPACIAQLVTDPALRFLQLDDALWGEAETLWAQGNANVLDFFKELPESRRVSVAYEDLLRAPDATVRRLCSFLRLPFEAAMCAPYTATNLATFEPAAAGGLGAGDPKLRQNTGIDASMADAWHKVKVPRALLPFAAHVAKELGYKLPAWKEPTLRAGAPAALERLNAATGGTPVVVVHGVSGTVTRVRPLAQALSAPVLGLRVNRRDLAFESFEELAAEYVQALLTLDLPSSGIFIAATDEFGAQLACALFRQLDERRRQGHAQTLRVLSLVFLDCCVAGPVNDDLTTDQRALWELALEATALSGQREPELAQFLESIGACADDDEALELMASAFRPSDLPMPKWNALVSRVVNFALKALELEAEGLLPLGGGNAVLLCSDSGFAARLPARNARVWSGVFSAERVAGVEQLLATDAAERVAATLEKLLRSFTRRR